MTRKERKQLLIRACAADRNAWAQACRARQRRPAQLAGSLLKALEPVTALLPGRIGRWVSGTNMLVRLGRRLGWLTS
jgi:hypothetical protein